jgi:threonine synthase
MLPIRYISTRGGSPALSFEEVVLAGLAPDGGLYVPDRIPTFSPSEMATLKGLPYADLAYAIISRFVDESIDKEALKHIIADSYKSFSHEAVAPLTQLDAHTFMLELFHGPTLAFKDFALQFLGRLLAHILDKKKQKAIVIGATSGDTGSAAIHGCRGHKGMEIFILHPKGRVSDVQRRQMTTVLDSNVHNIAIEGTFDDCQAMVKALFADEPFRSAHNLTAVNSINWARIVAQIVYYFYAALQLGKSVSFSVPTGNFGDIYAGYLAKRMGLPIEQLIIATNRNNILTRCLETGTYAMEQVVPTLSPSMDIQISSNFERLIYNLYDGDGKAVVALMEALKTQRRFTLSVQALGRLRAEFSSSSVDDAATLAMIREMHAQNGLVLDPHTAVGLAAGRRCRAQTDIPLIVLATAHAAKFPDAIKTAISTPPLLPESLKSLVGKKERFDTLENNLTVLKTYIESRVS